MFSFNSKLAGLNFTGSKIISVSKGNIENFFFVASNFFHIFLVCLAVRNEHGFQVRLSSSMRFLFHRKKETDLCSRREGFNFCSCVFNVSAFKSRGKENSSITIEYIVERLN